MPVPKLLRCFTWQNSSTSFSGASLSLTISWPIFSFRGLLLGIWKWAPSHSSGDPSIGPHVVTTEGIVSLVKCSRSCQQILSNYGERLVSGSSHIICPSASTLIIIFILQMRSQGFLCPFSKPESCGTRFSGSGALAPALNYMVHSEAFNWWSLMLGPRKDHGNLSERVLY